MASKDRDQGARPENVLQWLLARWPGEKREKLEQFVRAGRITINGAPAKSLKTPLAETDVVVLQAKTKETKSLLHPLTLLHEDDDILIIDKPRELLTSTNTRERRETVLKILDRYLKAKDERARTYLIHRLDRDASGLLVFGKTKRAFDSLKTQFYGHSIERLYVARVRGVPEEKRGRIDFSLVERADGTVRPVNEELGERGEDARTRFEVVHEEKDSAFVRVRLETGKKHQIRAHLAAIGHPLIGDPLYDVDEDGEPRSEESMLLRAMVLGLEHPATHKWVRFIAKPPEGAPDSILPYFADVKDRHARES